MTPKQKFYHLAKQHSIDVDFEPEITWLQVWTPKGKIFVTSGCHTDCSFHDLVTYSGKSMDWKLCYDNLKKIVELGFYDCEDHLNGECEYCNED